MPQSQIPNHKIQIAIKLQIQNRKTHAYGCLEFDHWELFVIWCLFFGIYYCDVSSNQFISSLHDRRIHCASWPAFSQRNFPAVVNGIVQTMMR